MNDCDREIGAICLSISPFMHYLIDSDEYPKDLWTELDRTFGNKNEDNYRNLDSTPRTARVIYSKLFSSTLSRDFFQDEEEAGSSTQSIWIEESLLEVTPSPAAPEFYKIYDISYTSEAVGEGFTPRRLSSIQIDCEEDSTSSSSWTNSSDRVEAETFE